MPTRLKRWPLQLIAALAILVTLAFLLLACAPPAPVPQKQSGGAPAREPVVASAPTAAPAAASAPRPQATSAPAASGSALAAASMSVRPDRMIVKSAEIDLVAPDTDAAVDQVLGVVSDVSGYVLNMLTWQEGAQKLAKVTMRMPCDRYEEALRRLRRIGEVQKESSTGEDVTDQYVDLEAQQRNLEATAERLRSFLAKANTVEEALKVNESLEAVEGEIEQVKGRLNYLSDRSAFSTISVYIHPTQPTPTPTSTPTATPTETPTPAPTAWSPLRTVGQAGGVLVDILKLLADVSVWLAIVVVPVFVLPAAVIWWIGWGRKGPGPKGGAVA